MGPKCQIPDEFGSGRDHSLRMIENPAKKLIVCGISITATLTVAVLGLAGIVIWLNVVATEDTDVDVFEDREVLIEVIKSKVSSEELQERIDYIWERLAKMNISNEDDNRYELMLEADLRLIEVREECSCVCGNGTSLVTKKCEVCVDQLWGKCQWVQTDISRCSLKDEVEFRPCKNYPCLVTKLVERTLDQSVNPYASSNGNISFKGVLQDGQVCDMGVVGGPFRDFGGIYENKMEKECNVCAKSGDETFVRLDISTTSDDAWWGDYVTVTFNRNIDTYYPPPSSGYTVKGMTVQFASRA